MKDLRGSHVSAIRTAIFKTFGLQLASGRRKNSKDIMEWKQSKEVNDSYNKLFTEGTTIENITNLAFPSLTDANDEKFNDMYIYTASVCDIILNPNYPSLEVSRKSLELRLIKFKVFYRIYFVYLKIKFINQIKIRKRSIKMIKFGLVIQRRFYVRNFPIVKRNPPSTMKMKKSQKRRRRQRRYLTTKVSANMINYSIISGNYFNYFNLFCF